MRFPAFVLACLVLSPSTQANAADKALPPGSHLRVHLADGAVFSSQDRTLTSVTALVDEPVRLKGCTLFGLGSADAVTRRVNVHVQSASCPAKTADHPMHINGYLTDADGLQGLRGKVTSDNAHHVKIVVRAHRNLSATITN